MKQRKLRGYVLPTIYVLILMIVFGAVSLITTLFKTNPNYLYTIGVLKDVDAIPVIDMEGSTNVGILEAYHGDGVEIDKYFYDVKGDSETQEKALIYFSNTYMKNTGVLYKSENEFQAVAVLNGTVLNIKEDELLGKLVEVEHNTNLRTIYYSLGEVNVKIGDVIDQGDVIGVSGSNKISEASHGLLFEVYYNGTLINPLEFYKMDASTLN